MKNSRQRPNWSEPFSCWRDRAGDRDSLSIHRSPVIRQSDRDRLEGYSQRRATAGSSRLTRRIGTYADTIVTRKKNETTHAYIHGEPCAATFESDRMTLLVASARPKPQTNP